MKKGIDISLWDPTANNWSQYTWDFLFVKVSEGYSIDKKFDVHWIKSKGRTLRGGYHFFRAFVDPREAARRFLGYLDGDLGELPPVLDLESTNNIEVKTVVSRALTWLIECEYRTGITPMIYSRTSFLTGPNSLHIEKYPDFARYPLWLAVYPYDKLYDGYTEVDRTRKIKSILENPSYLPIPKIPKPFVDMPYIQWTSKGNPFDVPGYYTGVGHKEAVDFNFQLVPNVQPESDVFINIRSLV